jgi:hypothetical protein
MSQRNEKVSGFNIYLYILYMIYIIDIYYISMGQTRKDNIYDY